jgi:hypothetical protein
MLIFSANGGIELISQNPNEIKRQMILIPEILNSHRVKLKMTIGFSA